MTGEVDVNGITKVTAEDVSTGRSESLTLGLEHTLTNEQVEHMITDAETHSQEDEQLRNTLHTSYQLVIVTILHNFFLSKCFLDEVH